MSTKPEGRRWPRRVALAVCVAVSLLTVAVIVAQRHAKRAVESALRDLGRQLGRSVTAGRVDLRLVPALDITVTELRIGPAVGAQGVALVPALTVASVHVHAALWPLLRRRAREVTIDTIEVRRPVITAALLPGDRSSLDDLRRSPREARRSSSLRALRIGRATITGGALRVIDASNAARAPQTLSVDAIDVIASHLGPERDTRVTVTAALFAGGPNLRAALTLGPLRVGADGAPKAPSLRGVALDLRDVDATPALRVAATHRPLRVLSGNVTGHAELTLDARARPRRVTTSLALGALVLRRREGGQRPPVEARVELELALDPDRADIDVSRFDLTLDGMSVSGRAHVASDGGHPELRDLAVASRAVDLARLEPWLPPHVLPRGSALSGPLALSANARRTADGSADIDATLDLTAASIELPTWLHKPAGTTLSAQFGGNVRRGDVRVDRLGVTLGPLGLLAHGEVRSARDFNLSFDSGEVPIDPLLRLLPGVRRSVPEGVVLHGRLQASGALRTEGATHAARARVALRGAMVRTPTLTLEGDADASLDASLSAEHVTAELTVDAGRARVVVPERVDKPAGAPLHVYARGERVGSRTALSALSLTLPGARVEGRGTYDSATRRAELHLPTCEVELARLLQALPAAAARVPRALAGASSRFGLTLEGDTDEPRAARLRVERFDLRTELGSLHGSVDATGLDEPRRVRFELWGDVLDEGALARALPPSNAHHGPPAWLRTVDLEGSLRADVVRTSGLTLSSPRAEVTLRDGRLLLRSLSLGVAGGLVRADGTTIDLASPSRHAAVHLRAQHIDLFEASTAAGTELARRPTGSLDVDADVTVEGADSDAMRASLTGRAHLSGLNIVVRRLVSPTVSIVLPLIGERPAPGNRTRRDPEHPMLVRSFDAPLRFEHGDIHTTGPITADTDAGALSLTGSIGANGTLALAGQIRIPPEVFERMSQGSRAPSGAVPVSIRVTGNTGAPHVEVNDLGATIRALAGSRLRAITRGIFQ